MPRIDFRSPRLFVETPLAAGETIVPSREQAHYIVNVLRLAPGETVLVFNARDGEWRARLDANRRAPRLLVAERTRPQDVLPDVRYVFAPIKHARLDYMVQKAVELGAHALVPVLTRHTQVARVNTGRMRANVIEAAEQCGILGLAEVAEPVPLERFLATREAGRLLVFCDEAAETASPIAALEGARAGGERRRGCDVLIGPEGGFAEDEQNLIARQASVLRLSLGPRILRADTAAVAALTLVMAVLGDWQENGKNTTID